MLFSPPPLHGSPLLTPQSLRFHPAQHLAESLILFKNLDIINTVSSGEIEQHQREHCLLVCPPLIRFPHMDMSPDTIANTQDGGKVQIDRKTRHGRHAPMGSLFFVLVGKNALCHNVFTSLVIDSLSKRILSYLIIRTNEVF